jgi:hypothetical protein
MVNYTDFPLCYLRMTKNYVHPYTLIGFFNNDSASISLPSLPLANLLLTRIYNSQNFAIEWYNSAYECCT